MSRWIWTFSAVVAFVLGALSWAPLRRWSSAAEVLLDLSVPKARPAAHSVTKTDLVLPDPAGVRARVYEPSGLVHQCIVLGHGVHHLGIDEPRLTRFATELSLAGARVLTPELSDLADYRITRSGADVLGGAVRYLAAHCPTHQAGLLGFSFAGGLSLLAATDASTNGKLAYVTSVGGYHDLGRVLRFLLTDTVETPDGPQHRTAHEYGIVVLLYRYLDQFVPPGDLTTARNAVRAWLEEDRARAWTIASARSAPETEALFMQLATGHVHDSSDRLQQMLSRSSPDIDALSPRGHLSDIPVPVYLLHGTEDSVIPKEETLWAERELGAKAQMALVTPLLEHVEVSGTPRLLDEVALVRFMARLL